MLHHNRTSIRRALLLTLAAVLLAAFASACGKKETKNAVQLPGTGQGKVIATYKGGEINQGEFDKYTAYLEVTDPQRAMYLQIPQFKEQFVQQFAMFKTFASRATDDQKKAADKEMADFDKQINDAMTKQPEFKKAMDEKKLTVDEMKQISHMQALTSQVVQAKQTSIEAGVKDADLKAEFDKTPSDYNIATVRHILITTSDPQTGQEKRSDADALKLAKDVKSKLEKGGDWKVIAKQYSEDPGSKDNGGLYEKQVVKGWVPEFKDAANKQEIGKIGEPVKVSYGYHVIQVESRTTSSFDKLDAATKTQMKKEMVDKQLQTFLQDEQKQMDIKVTLPAEPAPSAPAASPSASPSAPASPSAGK